MTAGRGGLPPPYDREWSSKEGGVFVPIPEPLYEHEAHWGTEEKTELSAVAKTAIYMMDTVTAMVNRMIRWADKGLGGPQ